MPKVVAYLGQGVVYGVIALCLGAFATWPSYRAFPDNKARLMISFSHGGQRLGDCRKLTPAEIAEVAANMRRAEVCPRERQPIIVEMHLSDELLYSATVPPTGIAGDGASQVYQGFTVDPGKHRLRVAMRDSPRAAGFDYEREAEITLEPGQSFVVDFRSEMGGFIFSGNES